MAISRKKPGISIWTRKEEVNPTLIPHDIEIVPDLVDRVHMWRRQDSTMWISPENPTVHDCFLSWCEENQPVSEGSRVVMAFGGRIVPSEPFTTEEIENYITVYGLNRNRVCVFVRYSS